MHLITHTKLWQSKNHGNSYFSSFIMDINTIHTVFEKLFASQNMDASPPDYKGFESKITLLERLSEVENSSINVLDFYQKKYVFVRSKFSELIGYDKESGMEIGPAYYLSLMHPDDIPLLLDTFRKAFLFISNQPVGERKNFKLIYNFRIKGKHNVYYPLIQQAIPLELDSKGNIWLLLNITDLLPDKDLSGKVNRQLINIKDGKQYLFNDDFNDQARPILSIREIEVLKLASRGFASKEIADKLFISVNTVNNHRQKILEKTEAANTAEAVTYAKYLGLL